MNKTELKRKFIQLLLLLSIPINATSFDLAVVRVAKVPAKALYVTQPKGEEDRLFVVNQKGLIHIIENGEVKKKPFLDISECKNLYTLTAKLISQVICVLFELLLSLIHI